MIYTIKKGFTAVQNWIPDFRRTRIHTETPIKCDPLSRDDVPLLSKTRSKSEQSESEELLMVPPSRDGRHDADRPVKIAWRVDNGSNIATNLKPLIDILSRPDVAHSPIVIFSMNGTTRCGKSFLLNIIIKYLKFGRFREFDDHGTHWMDQQLEPGFDWGSEDKVVTNGILIWSSPFFWRHEGQTMALIVMDNQGVFDNVTSSTPAYKFFCLSNLLSSLFTYADTKAHTSEYLTSLHSFMEFSKSVEHDKRIRQESQEHHSPYQFGNAILLFRDYTFTSHSYFGCAFYDDSTSGPNLYQEVFSTDVALVRKSLQKKRSEIVQFYNQITLCTMCSPGRKREFPNPTHNTCRASWDPEFVRGMEIFVEQVFSPNFLGTATKKIYGEEITGEKLIPYLKTWEDAVLSGNYTISELTLMEANRHEYFRNLIDSSLEIFQREVNDYQRNPEDEDFQAIYERAWDQVNVLFWNNCSHSPWKKNYYDLLKTQVCRLMDNHSDAILKAQRSKREDAKYRAKQVEAVGVSVLAAGAAAVVSLEAGTLAGVVVVSTGGLVLVAAVGCWAVWMFRDAREKRAVKASMKRGVSAGV